MQDYNLQLVTITFIIPTGAPITIVNDAIEMLLVATDKTIYDLSKSSKEAMYLLRLWLISFLSLISAMK